jgi:hypothetical protein
LRSEEKGKNTESLSRSEAQNPDLDLDHSLDFDKELVIFSLEVPEKNEETNTEEPLTVKDREQLDSARL